jgi:hypothetical protein
MFMQVQVQTLSAPLWSPLCISGACAQVDTSATGSLRNLNQGDPDGSQAHDTIWCSESFHCLYLVPLRPDDGRFRRVTP